MGILKPKFKKFTKNPLIIGILFLFIGSILGLVYSFLIDPVEWVDVPLERSRADIQEDYLRMALDRYTYTFDSQKLQQRWGNLGAAGPTILGQVIANPGRQNLDTILHLQNTIIEKNAIPSSGCITVAKNSNDIAGNNNFCIFLWLITICCGGVLVYHFNKRINQLSQPVFSYNTQLPTVTQLQKKKDHLDIPTPPQEKEITKKEPHSIFLASYQLGDDLFCESFSIETDKRKFLGECGIDIAHVINQGPPKQISAFDVWLFDKDEIDTKSLVLMSELSYQNDNLRSRLKAKGKTSLIEVGKYYQLQTENINLEIRILDVFYDCFSLVDPNCIERLVVEFSVWILD
jgi:hypothetical protein